MKDFFREKFISFRDFISPLFKKLGSLPKKTKIIVLAIAAVLVVALIVVGIVSSVKNKPTEDYKATAEQYAKCVMNYDYDSALDSTIAAYKSTDDYFQKYIGDLQVGEDDSKTAKTVADAMSDEVQSYISLKGLYDFDAFCSDYFTKAKSVGETYVGESAVTQSVLKAAFKSNLSSYFSKTIDAYKTTYENNGGYNPSLSLASTKDFTVDEVNKYKKIKEKNSASAYEKCGVKTKNIDSVKRVIYNVNVNNVPIREISFIMLQMNGKWYVDFTQE